MPKPAPQDSLAEKIAWYCLLALPVAVPLAIGRLPLSGADSLNIGNVVVEFFMLSVLTSVSLIAWSIALLKGDTTLRNPPFKWWLLGFLALVGISTITALNRPTALFGESDQMLGLVTFLLGAGVYFLATQLLVDPSRIRALARAAVIGGFGVAAFGTLQNLGIDLVNPKLDASLEWIMSQGASTIGNPDSTGTYLVFPLVLCVGLLLAEKARGWRIFEGVSFAVIAYALIISLTRGAWIGAAVGVVALLVTFTRSSKRIPNALKWIAGGFVALVGIGLVVSGPNFARRFTELASGADAGGGRLILWREALIVIARHPLLGVGADSYRYGWFPIRLPEGMRVVGDAINNDPHNIVLLIAATLGIPALIALLVFAVSVLLKSAKTALATSTSPDRLVFAAWWAAFLGFGVALVFTFNTIPATLVFWMCLGVLSAPDTVPLTEQRRGAVALVSVTLAAFGVTMIVVSSLTVASVYNLAYAKSLRSIDRARLAVRLASWHYNARVEETFQQGLAAVLAAQGKDTAAASLIKQADAAMVALIARNPYSLTGYSLRTAFLLEVGTRMNDRTYLEEALQAANGGLKVQPTSIEMATKKATVLTSLGRYAEAADTMSTIWELYPADPAPGVLYADSLIRAGRLAEAKRVVGVLETRFPSDPEVLRVKGLVSGG